MYPLRCWLLISLIIGSSAYGQNVNSVSSQDSTLTSADSLFIFDLIDSLLTLDQARPQLAFRLGYNSNVLSAGRTLGIENFGITPGATYYHPSGFYGDVSGFWSADFDPKYYLTVATVGYMRDFSKKLSVMGGYDRYFYTVADQDTYIPYRNSLSVSPILDLKPFSISVNYSFYFGDQYAHRIMPGISCLFQKRKFLKLDRIAIRPSIYVLFGNEVIITQEYLIRPKTLAELRYNLATYGSPYGIIQTTKNVFGVMNYALTLPLSLSKKNFGFSFSYTYNIPKALPGETLTFSESTYLSASLLYFIEIGRKKKPL